MSRSHNSATIIGNLGRDPDIRNTGTGSRVANFTVATSESWKGKDGEKQEATEWHRITVFGPLVDVIEKYVRKGTCVFIRGKLNTRRYTDAAKVERFSTEIVVNGYGAEFMILDPKDTGGKAPAVPPAAQRPAAVSSKDDIYNDDIPF